MALTYLDLQNEVKRRATREQGGTQFDTAIKNIINTSLFRVCREALWRPLRRNATITTKTSYTTGTGYVSATSSSTTVNVLGATFITDGVEIGRRVKLSGDSDYFYVKQITGETSLVLDMQYSGTTTTSGTYEILPQAEYNLPVQCGHRAFLWHEDYGYPYLMGYVVDQDFYRTGLHLTEKNVPTNYRMWGENMAIKSVLTPTSIAVFSTSSNDTNLDVTIFGTSGGYPACETIKTSSVSGATVTTGITSFSEIERVVKSNSSQGRISVTASGNTSIVYAVIPHGDTTAGIQYKKVQIYPLPTRAFEIHVQYYKDPYRLVNDGDVHELGQEFDEAIILLSVAKIKAESSQTEASNFYSLYQDEIKSLRRTNVDKIDSFFKMRKPYGQNDHVTGNLLYKQAGSYYGPASRY